ncbi:hypothetical protein [Acidovorax sp. CCYZU-2555]|uniref:hypothetical protein n=1 Tax=Acidovorax sp. CCYZU-2555 TaxID=2835042 RepID=UPI001BD13BBE|nr:hypothetical protein [Acidovorax sp. CCYZU-2555]MBS7776558.1 hypothetical protein [Acidovorax sp. CCYZU-2555]
MMKQMCADFVLAAASMGAALCIICGVVTPSIAFILGAWALLFGGLMSWHALRRERRQPRAAMRPGGKFRCIEGGGKR